MVTFVNSKQLIKKLPLSSDLESKDPSMYKRLQYAKEILIQLINKQDNPTAKQAVASSVSHRQPQTTSTALTNMKHSSK
jgi:hypothetical protein